MPTKLYIVSTMIYTHNALGKHRITTQRIGNIRWYKYINDCFFDANVHFPPQEIINCMGLNHMTSTLNMLLHHKYICPPLLIQIMLMHKIKFCLPMDFIHCFKKWIMNILHFKILCLWRNKIQMNHFNCSLLKVLVHVKKSC